METHMQFLKRVGNNLRTIRKAKGYTQRDIAALVPLKPDTVCDIERGQRDWHILTLKSIADALEIDFKKLI